MTASVALIVAAVVLGWCLVGGPLQRLGLSGPMVFLAAGALLAQLGVVDVAVDSATLEVIIELALVTSLFSDASSADLRVLGRHGGWAMRMLLIGLPLSIAVGAGAGMLVLPVLGWSTAVLLAASLAATDASLSASVLSDERVPRRVRLALNLESGLNDGLAARAC
jgi:sodium/hydrogen antiporter